MTETELLEEVKIALGVGGTYQDKTLKIYMDEAIEFLRDAGVSEDFLKSEKVVGIVTRGVADLWNYGAGNAQLSLYFKQRASQLVYKSMKEGRHDDVNTSKFKSLVK